DVTSLYNDPWAMFRAANPAPAVSTASPLPAGTVGTAYSQTLAVAGGTAPFTWSVSAGALPAGLNLNAAGVLNGTPTTAGTSNFTVKVSDSVGAGSTKAVAVTIKLAVAAALNVPVLTTIVDSPASLTLSSLPSQVFVASALYQSGNQFFPQPTFFWGAD